MSLLAATLVFGGRALAAAVAATFTSRGATLPAGAPITMTAPFAGVGHNVNVDRTGESGGLRALTSRAQSNPVGFVLVIIAPGSLRAPYIVSGVVSA